MSGGGGGGGGVRVHLKPIHLQTFVGVAGCGEVGTGHVKRRLSGPETEPGPLRPGRDDDDKRDDLSTSGLS